MGRIIGNFELVTAIGPPPPTEEDVRRFLSKAPGDPDLGAYRTGAARPMDISPAFTLVLFAALYLLARWL